MITMKDPMFSLLIALLLFGIARCTDQVQLHRLRSSRLCNNDDDLSYSSRLCESWTNMGWRVERKCDERRLILDKCRIAVVDLEQFTLSTLLALLPSLDDDRSLRRIVIKLANSSVLKSDSIGGEIDSFLQPRLWWYVEKEPHSWDAPGSARTIVFSRVQHEYENSLRILAATQYPDDKLTCEATPMLLIHRDFTAPSWYETIVEKTSIAHVQMPYAVSAVFVSSEEHVQDSSSPAFLKACSQPGNKWNCAYLPVTSCALPKVVADCQSRQCVNAVVDDRTHVTAIFSSASSDGVYLPRSALNMKEHEDPAYIQLSSVLQRANHAPETNLRLAGLISDAAKHRFPPMKYMLPHSKSSGSSGTHATATAQTPFRRNTSAPIDYYTYNLLLRPSAPHRAWLAQTMGDFRRGNAFSAQQRCVAAVVHKRACSASPSAKTASLQDAVDHAAALVDTAARTLFVTTDDMTWLNDQREQLKSTRSEWTVVALATTQSDGRSALLQEDVRYGAAPGRGEMLQVYIELARQCEAYVGQSDCEHANLVYKSLCAQHGQREHVCPPSADLQGTKS
jgi:hypothetical protein